MRGAAPKAASACATALRPEVIILTFESIPGSRLELLPVFPPSLQVLLSLSLIYLSEDGHVIALLFRLVKPGVELSKLVMSRLVIRVQFSGLQQNFECILKLAFGGVAFAELEIRQHEPRIG